LLNSYQNQKSFLGGNAIETILEIFSVWIKKLPGYLITKCIKKSQIAGEMKQSSFNQSIY